MAHDVFISYSRRDIDTVKIFLHRFKQAGFSVWIDENGIESGEAFKRVITQAIMDSTVFVFFSSAAANSSEWTAKEIGIASHLHKHIIPVRLDSSSYNLDIMFDLINLDFIDYTNVEKRDAMVAKLISSISHICGKSRQTPKGPEVAKVDYSQRERGGYEEKPKERQLSKKERRQKEEDDFQNLLERFLHPEREEAKPVNGVKVRLISAGSMRLSVVKCIKEAYDVDLATAMDAMKSAPTTLKELEFSKAKTLVQEINNLGGKAEIV